MVLIYRNEDEDRYDDDSSYYHATELRIHPK